MVHLWLESEPSEHARSDTEDEVVGRASEVDWRDLRRARGAARGVGRRELSRARAAVEAWTPLPLVFVSRSIRAAVLLLVIVLLWLTEPLLRRRFPHFGPRLLRRQIENGGAGFAKIGQLLAHRYDVLPDRYCEALGGILDDLPGLPAEVIKKRIRKELELERISDRFDDFEDTRLSAASIAQVHEARLKDGAPVVIKVIRPGIEKRFRIDLWLVGLGARFLSLWRPFRRMGIRAVVAELRQLTLEELDFSREARNINQLRDRMCADEIDHYAPRVYSALSTQHVITMEDIPGISVKELMDMATAARGESGDAGSEVAREGLDRWRKLGVTPERTARLMVRSFLEQAMHHRLFHADPHAANLIVMPGGTLAWIDHGMLGWLDERLWLHEYKLREAIAEGRLHDAYLHLLASMEPLPASDLREFEAEFKRILRDWLAAGEQPISDGGDLSDDLRSNYRLFARTLGAVRRAGLRLPAPLVRLYRTIIIGDMVVLRLDPEVDWQQLIRDFVSDQRLREVVELCERGLSLENLTAAVRVIVEGPDALVELMDSVHRRAEPHHVVTRVMTHAERAFRVVIGQAKVAVATATVVLFGISFPPLADLPLLQPLRVDTGRWLVLAGGLLIVWLLSQLQEELED